MKPRCTDCRVPLLRPGMCGRCCAERRRMRDFRREQVAFDTPEAKAERERRIPIYARLVAANVELPTR